MLSTLPDGKIRQPTLQIQPEAKTTILTSQVRGWRLLRSKTYLAIPRSETGSQLKNMEAYLEGKDKEVKDKIGLAHSKKSADQADAEITDAQARYENMLTPSLVDR